MNFIDYVIKKTDKYTKMGLDNPETKECLLTLQLLNYRARCLKEKLLKEYDHDIFDTDEFIDIDTELDEGYFDRIIKEPNKEIK